MGRLGGTSDPTSALAVVTPLGFCYLNRPHSQYARERKLRGEGCDG